MSLMSHMALNGQMQLLFLKSVNLYYIDKKDAKIVLKTYHYSLVSVEWLKRHAYDQHGLSSKPTCAFCCVFGKDTLWHYPLLGALGKQFYIIVISLLNYKQTAIPWHLWNTVE